MDLLTDDREGQPERVQRINHGKLMVDVLIKLRPGSTLIDADGSRWKIDPDGETMTLQNDDSTK